MKYKQIVNFVTEGISEGRYKKGDRVPGREFGIISYNDTPLKELLAGGITTLSTDFKLMGVTMAKLITNRKRVETIENPWKLTVRKSL